MGAVGLLAGALMALLLPASAARGFSFKDAQVLGRTIGFLDDGRARNATIAIVYAPSDAASKQDAQAVVDVIGAGLNTGRVRLQARLVAADQLGDVRDADAIYVSAGQTAFMAPIEAAAEARHIPTIAANLACVGADGCVVGYVSEPAILIVINRAAAQRTGVHFMQAFRMLVREQ
jgi:hypothetical protein